MYKNSYIIISPPVMTYYIAEEVSLSLSLSLVSFASSLDIHYSWRTRTYSNK